MINACSGKILLTPQPMPTSQPLQFLADDTNQDKLRSILVVFHALREYIGRYAAWLINAVLHSRESKHEAAHPGTGRVTRRNGASLVNSRSRVALVQTRQAMVTKKGCFEGLFEQETGVRDGKETKECNRA